MGKSARLLHLVCLMTLVAGFSLTANAQQQTTQQPPKKPAQKVAPVQSKPTGIPGRTMGGVQQTNRPALQSTNHVGVQTNRTVLQSGTSHTVHGNTSVAVRNTAVVGSKGYRFGTHGVRRDVRTFNQREHIAWQRGRWHHERRFGRDGWWWEVNGAWYWYAQPVEGPPLYVSDVEMVDDTVDAPPPAVVDYPAPPPPPASVLGGAVGGAILGGVLGGALTGRSGGAAAGALIGGATGAAIGAEAERRNGYYQWQGHCYYRYPSGEYAPVAPDNCY